MSHLGKILYTDTDSMQGEAYLVSHLGKILYTDTDSMQGEGFVKTMIVSNIAPINHNQPFLTRNSHKLYN